MVGMKAPQIPSDHSTNVPWDEVVSRFALGALQAPPERSTTGWGGHNVMWKVKTELGVFAIKQVGRALPGDTDKSFAVEMSAYASGIPAPRPVPSVSGHCYEVVAGTAFRCHEWVRGTAKLNEETSPREASLMGEVVARLHGCAIECEPIQGRPVFEESEWRRLAGEGRKVNAPWASMLRDEARRLVAVQRHARPHSDVGPTVGSHRDLNAHNVLFTDKGLLLIDWDAAGPAVPKTERAIVSMLWSQQSDGGYDANRTEAFLHGYRKGGGVVERDDAAQLTDWLDGLVWWMHENVEMALTMNTVEQHRAAERLLIDTLRGPETVVERQRFLSEVIERLDRNPGRAID